MKPYLTVVIPFRFYNLRGDLLNRISWPKLDNQIPNSVEFLLVDDGSPKEYIAEIRAKCLENNIKYLRLETENELFSIARARNHGAMRSSSNFIMFYDVDLLPYNGFYNDVLAEIKLNKLEQNTNDFLGFGVIYLTQKGTSEYVSNYDQNPKNKFIHHLIENDETYIEKFSTGTSVQLFNREYYLARGGNHEDFSGWGYEDLEFTCRAAVKSKKFPLPRALTDDYKNCRDVVEYKGFKSISRLFGDVSFAKGIILFHGWHEVFKSSDYNQRKSLNYQVYKNAINEFLNSNEEPEPLPDLTAGRTLIFTKNHPAICNREIMPRYGEVFIEDENRFEDIKSFASYLNENNISRVIFQNPYGNELRLKLYNYVKESKIPFYIVERGALPDSMFFDPNGFNADSASYNPEFWDKPINDEKRLATLNYIQNELMGNSALEIQPNRIIPRKLKRKLAINPDKKILFVPLQTPADTVIKYFCGESIRTYDEFLKVVKEVSDNLPSDWVLVYKKHPLTKESPDLGVNAICADEYNIKDLLSVADYVLLINSGVGVLSMLWGKPVLYTGKIFYEHNEINKQVKSASEVLETLNKGFEVNREKIVRFISYLIHDFYSFGKFETKLVDWSKDANMTVTTNIDFYRINNIGNTKLVIDTERKYKISTKSVLFDRYRFDLEYLSRGNTRRSLIIRRPLAKTKEERLELKTKRWNKFSKNPYQFFNDSRFIFLRPLKYLFKV